jgi:hypothetical protein
MSRFDNGCYISLDQETIHAADGTPLLYRGEDTFHSYKDGRAVLYLDRATNTLHRYGDGRAVFYFDPFGENLNRYRNVLPPEE